MFQVILRFALRQSDCRFFHFSAENLPIPLRVNDLRNLSVSGTIFGITTIKRTHNSLRIRTYRSVDSRELKTVWNQHLQKNRGEGGLIVNQIPDEGICPEEHRDEGSLFTSDEDAYPERVRRGGRVEGPLFAPDEGICPEEHRERAKRTRHFLVSKCQIGSRGLS